MCKTHSVSGIFEKAKESTARVILAGIVFAAASSCGLDSAFAQTASYLPDQELDQKLGLLEKPWDWGRINRVNVNSRMDQPPQVRAGGLPPYDQEVEKAQDLPGAVSSRR